MDRAPDFTWGASGACAFDFVSGARQGAAAMGHLIVCGAGAARKTLMAFFELIDTLIDFR